MHSVSVGIGYLANTLWMVAGMFLIAEKQISIGIFVGFISLSQEFSWPFNELSRLLAGLSRSKVSYERLYELFPVIAPLPAYRKIHQPIRSYACVMPALPTSQRTWYSIM